MSKATTMPARARPSRREQHRLKQESICFDTNRRLLVAANILRLVTCAVALVLLVVVAGFCLAVLYRGDRYSAEVVVFAGTGLFGDILAAVKLSMWSILRPGFVAEVKPTVGKDWTKT